MIGAAQFTQNHLSGVKRASPEDNHQIRLIDQLRLPSMCAVLDGLRLCADRMFERTSWKKESKQESQATPTSRNT